MAPTDPALLIRREDRAPVTILTLDNPPLNVLSQAVYKRLESLLDDLAASSEIRYPQLYPTTISGPTFR